MAKKILTICMSVIMVMSMFCAVPVSAEVTLPENIGTDYTPGERTGNILYDDEGNLLPPIGTTGSPAVSVTTYDGAKVISIGQSSGVNIPDNTASTRAM